MHGSTCGKFAWISENTNSPRLFTYRQLLISRSELTKKQSLTHRNIISDTSKIYRCMPPKGSRCTLLANQRNLFRQATACGRMFFSLFQRFQASRLFATPTDVYPSSWQLFVFTNRVLRRRVAPVFAIAAVQSGATTLSLFNLSGDPLWRKGRLVCVVGAFRRPQAESKSFAVKHLSEQWWHSEGVVQNKFTSILLAMPRETGSR